MTIKIRKLGGDIQYWEDMFAVYNLDTRQMVATRLTEDEAIEMLQDLEKDGNYELFNAVEYEAREDK